MSLRFLDLGVATLIGLTAITITYVSSPQGSDLATRRLVMESHLRDSLLGVVLHRGLAWFLNSSPSAICNAVSSLSNSSVTFTAVVDSASCVGTGPLGSVATNLTARTPERTVVLLAWVNA